MHRGNFRGLIVDSPPGVMYPGADVRGFSGFGHFGAVASASSSPAELSARMQGLLTGLRTQYDKMRAALPSGTAGLLSISNAISMKEKSMSDVLGGALTLEKWINGVEVLRAEMYSFANYVQNNASLKYELAKLGDDLKQTSLDYATAFVATAKKTATGFALAGAGTLVIVGLLLWKVGLPLLHTYLGGGRAPRAMGFHSRKRRRRAAW